MHFLALIFLAAGLVLAVPCLVLFVEILASRKAGPGPVLAEAQIRKAAVLVPAHNEVTGIARTVRNVMPQLAAGDYILVVADNCTDDTADVARKAGAQVVERSHSSLKGKGYALAFGLDEIRKRGADVVIFVDADCVLSAGAVGQLKAAAVTYDRPVQCADIMEAPEGLEARYAVASFAWRVKNLVRPLGLLRFGLPSQLMGTGMALPLAIADRVNFASGNLVEDLELGLNLAGQGFAPIFFPSVTVTSTFPASEAGELAQRRRWEGGSMAMLLTRGAKTVAGAIATGNGAKLAMGLDMLVPPLVMHGGLLAAYGLGAAGLALISGFVAPFAVVCVLLCLFAGAIGLAWAKAGRDVLPLRMWISLLPFVLRKLRVHRKLPAGQEKWVRADRADGSES